MGAEKEETAEGAVTQDLKYDRSLQFIAKSSRSLSMPSRVLRGSLESTSTDSHALDINSETIFAASSAFWEEAMMLSRDN
jgi:hypothetical protein